MRSIMRMIRRAVAVLGLAVLAALAAWPGDTKAAADSETDSEPDRRIDAHTWVDHDAHPIVPQPKERKLNIYVYFYLECLEEPLARLFDVPGKILWLLDQLGIAESEYESANLNAFDEVGNSTWFTSRNHLKAVPLDEIRRGPENHLRPQKPWTINDPKKGGVVPGFQIKDAAGKRWVIKLDPPGHPQLGSCADVVASRLLSAAGYNLPHDVALTFRREDLAIDEDLAKGKDGEEPFANDDLDQLVSRGHKASDGRYYGQASLFLPGKPVGPIDFRNRRPDDPNDWYTHQRRRELRGLYVIASWLNHWDTKDHQSLDMFQEQEGSLGFVRHYLLDVGGTLGAAAKGPKPLNRAFEHVPDYGWMGRRLITLGFVEEPWRKAKQETGIPSVGNFESEEFEPHAFKSMVPNPAFRELADADAYWGAKIVASFSNAQIEAAIEAAEYEDPRAREYLLKMLIERRDKVARYWFSRVVPLDFFHIKDAMLHFHDLAVDLGLERIREYDVRVESVGDGSVAPAQLLLRDRALPLASLTTEGQHLRLRLSVVGSAAKPTTIDLLKRGEEWLVTRVRHD